MYRTQLRYKTIRFGNRWYIFLVQKHKIVDCLGRLVKPVVTRNTQFIGVYLDFKKISKLYFSKGYFFPATSMTVAQISAPLLKVLCFNSRCK